MVRRVEIEMAAGFICSNCGNLGGEKQIAKGSLGFEIFLWLRILIPWLICSLWRLSSRYSACAHCKAPNLVQRTALVVGSWPVSSVHRYRNHNLTGRITEATLLRGAFTLRSSSFQFSLSWKGFWFELHSLVMTNSHRTSAGEVRCSGAHQGRAAISVLRVHAKLQRSWHSASEGRRGMRLSNDAHVREHQLQLGRGMAPDQRAEQPWRPSDHSSHNWRPSS